MYNHQGLVELQKKLSEAVEKLLSNSEMVCSETIQKTIADNLRSLVGNINSMNAMLETIFLMNHWGKSVHELYSEYPEKYNSPKSNLVE